MDQSNLKEELQKIDSHIADKKRSLKLASYAAELENNEAFKELVLGEFINSESERIMGVLTTPNKFEKGQLDIFYEKLAAIRHFKEFFKYISIEAAGAQESIDEHEKYRAEVTKSMSETPADELILEAE